MGAKRALWVTCAMISCACSTSVETTSHERAAITNGASDAADPAVVALIDARGVTCSGTLISPHVVLTAAHCTEGVLPHGATKILFGGDAASGVLVEIADVHVHPSYDSAGDANDIALLALAGPTTATPIAPLSPTADATLAGATVRVVGFGETAQNAGNQGQKRSGTSKITAVASTTFDLSASPSQPCNGDSGGPALLTVGGAEFVAGVTSHGDVACAAHDTETRVDAFADFVSAYLSSTADGAAHTGDRCFYPAHCATGACVTAADDPRLSYCAPSCASPSDCPPSMRCDASQCRFPTPTPGAIGSACTDAAQCIDADCDAKHVCSHRCVDANDCPSGFDCEAIGAIDFYCTPAPPAPSSSSSCALVDATTKTTEGSASTIGALIPLFFVWIRRRRRNQP